MEVEKILIPGNVIQRAVPQAITLIPEINAVANKITSYIRVLSAYQTAQINITRMPKIEYV